MKKIVLSILMVASLCLAACGQKNAAEQVSVEAKTKSYSDLDALERDADVIVKVKRLEEENVVIKHQNEAVVGAYTFSSVSVEEVYYDGSQSLTKGDSIRLLENEAYDKDTNKTYHIADYYMMKTGCEYLLFLQKASDANGDYYVSLGVNYGTVSLESDGRAELFKAAKQDRYSNYEQLWNLASEKYCN